jgi:hypothetical protein
MTEYELTSLAYAATEALQTEETTFLTILFGYLMAAHFLGARLPKTQLIVFNSMYLVTILGLIFNMWLQWEGVYNWMNSATAVASNQTIVIEGAASGEAHIYSAICIYILLVLASLWFMWNVRRAKSE